MVRFPIQPIRTAMIALFSVAVFSATSAQAQDKPTVESLLKQGYEVIGVFPSNAGPGLLLEDDDDDGADKLMMCFVAETPQSAEITTQYCKPVR